jgi:hypothetical protein
MSNPNPSPATRFKKGNTFGRAVGTPNKITVSSRQVLDDAFHMIGGTKRLAEWILKSPQNEYCWWSQIWPRTIPVSATVRNEVEHSIAPKTADELREALERHGLPPTVFGYDKPLLNGPTTIDAVPTGGVSFIPPVSPIKPKLEGE